MSTVFSTLRNRHSEVFLGKGVPKICYKFTGEHQYRNVISIKLQNIIKEQTMSLPVNFAIFPKTSLSQKTSGRLLLNGSLNKKTKEIVLTHRCQTLRKLCLLEGLSSIFFFFFFFFFVSFGDSGARRGHFKIKFEKNLPNHRHAHLRKI